MTKQVNTHGLKFQGLRKCCGSMGELNPYDSLFYELFYDRVTGEVWTILQIGQSWTEYRDRDIVKVGNYCCHLTMQEIVDEVRATLKAIKEREEMDNLMFG